jgi:glycogen operon protein
MHEPANAPGHVPHHKLGSTWDGTATTFRLFSRHATRVQLELASGATHDLVRGDDDTWELATPGAPPGTAYGFRVHGPFDPPHGQLFNPHKRLLDP